MMTTKPLFLTFLILISWTFIMAHKYEGSYILKEVFDADMAPIELPDIYHISIDARSKTRYSLGIKVGNQMGCYFDVLEGSNHAVFGEVHSTMTMSPENVFIVEMALDAILPEVNTILLEDGILTLHGSTGRIVCELVA
jgi:hypothetical protein